MSDFPATELSWRLRANRGRRLRPEFATTFAAAFGYEPEDRDFAELPETDRLGKELLARLDGLHPARTWPKSQGHDVFDHLLGLSARIDPDHYSYLAFFGGWEYIGALRVRSQAILSSAQDFWREGREPLCLLTPDLVDGLFLDYTEPEQMFGADEYELYAWGAFAERE